MLKITAIGNLTNDVELKVTRPPKALRQSCVSPRTAATGDRDGNRSPTLSPSRYAALGGALWRSSPWKGCKLAAVGDFETSCFADDPTASPAS